MEMYRVTCFLNPVQYEMKTPVTSLKSPSVLSLLILN